VGCWGAGRWPRSSPRRPFWSPTGIGTGSAASTTPRAWVRKVAINQRSLFLRAYLRQQTNERDAVARDEDDSIKLADDHAEVWQAVRTLPPLQAQVIALHYYEDYSVAQVAAALGKAPGTIKAQLHHGRRKLARLLGAEIDRRSSR
jgi:RNA polymerase sigma factor (sigma-70 family)